MVRLIRAIYEDGVFRPIEAFLGLPDRSPVQLRVEAASPNTGCLSDLAGRWSKEDAEEIEALIEAEFERIDPHDW